MYQLINAYDIYIELVQKLHRIVILLVLFYLHTSAAVSTLSRIS